MIEQLFNSPILYSLSLTLLHFLWQGLLVALILKSAFFLIDNNKSKLRYALATLAMFSNAILAVLTFIMVYPDTSSGINSSLSPIPLNNLVNELTQKNALLSYQELLPSILAYSLPYLSLLWLATLCALAIKLLIEVRNVNNLPLHSTVAPSPELMIRFGQLAKQIKLTKTPRLLISLKAEVPMAIGWLKPVVLLPASMVTGLDSAQLEMLILHELAHIRRHDYLVNFVQTLVELLFFFHPCVHWIGKQMRNEREYCSDDIAVQHCGDAIAYAHTLTDTASLCAKGNFHTIPTMAMASSGGDLKARILRLVDHHCAPSNNMSKWLASASLLFAFFLLSLNQLLTMPFAQQLNNQFPWQESGFSQNNIINNNTFSQSSELTEPDDLLSSITNDSIAQQLLKQDENIAIQAQIVSESTNALVELPNEITSTKPSEIVSNLKTSKPIRAKAIPSFSDESALLTDTASKLPQEQIQNTKRLSPSVNLGKESQVIKSPKTTTDKITLQHEQNDIEQFQKNNTIGAKENKINETIQSLTKSAAKPKPLIAKQPSNTALQKAITSDNTLISQSKPYRELSYQNEIIQLSQNDELYKPSFTQQSIKSQVEKLKLATQKTEINKRFLPAKLLNPVNPEYPSLAKRRGIEMEVKVNFTIDQSGKVKDIKFPQQSKLIYFKSAIRSAIRKWRFSPAVKNNVKVESKMTKIFSFSLEA